MNNHQRISETVTGVGCYAVLSCFSHVRLFVAPWTAACQASLSFTISWSLLRVMSIELVMLSNHLILCCPFSSCLQSFPASGSFPISWPFTSGGISPSNEYSEFISFRIDWFDLLAVKGLSRVFFSTWKACENAGFRSPARNIKALQVTY